MLRWFWTNWSFRRFYSVGQYIHTTQTLWSLAVSRPRSDHQNQQSSDLFSVLSHTHHGMSPSTSYLSINKIYISGGKTSSLKHGEVLLGQTTCRLN